jgi:hypothetical protein
MKTRNTVAALIFCAALGAQAENRSLGFLTANGTFQLDQSKIWNTATLFDGSVVETGLVHCRIHLSDGSEIDVAGDSRVRFFAGRAVIQKGAMEVRSTAVYRVDARDFHISTEGSGTVAAVRFEGPAGVAASAAKGSLRIAGADGLPLANVIPGKGVTLTPENTAAPGLTKLSGCVQSTNGSFWMTDLASNITFAIQAKNLASQVGSRVEIRGTASNSGLEARGTSPAVQAATVKVLQKGSCAAPAAQSAASNGAGPATQNTAPVSLIRGVTVANLEGRGDTTRGPRKPEDPGHPEQPENPVRTSR